MTNPCPTCEARLRVKIPNWKKTLYDTYEWYHEMETEHRPNRNQEMDPSLFYCEGDFDTIWRKE